MMTTATTLGELVTEAVAYPEAEGAGSRGLTMHRPAATPLRNDGIWHYWMVRGEVYRFSHDGTGWRVTCRTWPSGHVYRLVEAQDARFTHRLPLTRGVLDLDRGRTYAVREAEPYGAWTVYAA